MGNLNTPLYHNEYLSSEFMSGLSLASHLQEACERSLAEMESSHQQVMQELQRHHERELQRLQQEKEWLLAEETAATASGEGPGQERHSRARPHEPPSCGSSWLQVFK